VGKTNPEHPVWMTN